MTEQEWLACENLASIECFFVAKASKRKVGLFACACCRQLWDHLQDTEIQRILEAGERYADGRMQPRTAGKWYDRARAAFIKLSESPCTPSRLIAYNVVMKAVVSPELGYVHGDVVQAIAANSGAIQGTAAWNACVETNAKHLIMFMRDIFGNPFHPLTVDPSWLTWHNGTVPKIGQSIYDNRSLPAGILDPVSLAVLADALEEAGCDNADILNHCRMPGEHVRGCWVVDLLIGKD